MSEHWMWGVRVVAAPGVPKTPAPCKGNEVSPAPASLEAPLLKRIQALSAASSFDSFRAQLIPLLEEMAAASAVEGELESYHTECALALAQDVGGFEPIAAGCEHCCPGSTGGKCALASLADPRSKECDRLADAAAERAVAERHQSERLLAQPTIVADFVAKLEPLRSKAHWSLSDQQLVRELIERDGFRAVRGVVGDHRQLQGMGTSEMFLIRVATVPAAAAGDEYFVRRRDADESGGDSYVIGRGRSGAAVFTLAGASWFLVHSGRPATDFWLVRLLCAAVSGGR